MIHIEALQPADWTTAMALALGSAFEEENAAHVTHCVNLLESGVLDPDAIHIAREENGTIVGVQVCVPLQGASCLFWLPSAADDVAELLIKACLDSCQKRGSKITQAFVSPEEMSLAQPLLRQGFRHITRMHQLRHSLRELPPVRASSVRYESLQTAGYQAFARTLERTYQDTLDCPELNGKRTLDEIIAGHQAEGKFDPVHWWIAYQDREPVGVVMLVELTSGTTWDLSYMGIVPEHRRRGYGRTLLQFALQDACDQMATSMVIAVDGRNTPAMTLYRSAGFTEVESYEVLLQFLN